jgi:hypothetical protein
MHSIVRFTNYGLSSLLFAIVLAGCGEGISRSPDPTMSSVTGGSAADAHAQRGKSWMLPGAKGIKRLLYVSNYGAAVLVYDYKDLKPVGTLLGFAASDAECVDAKGDIWIISNSGGTCRPEPSAIHSLL